MAQSGISASQALLTAWTGALADSSTRILMISIDSESLVPAHKVDAQTDFESDFSLLFVEDASPAYILLEPTPSSHWIFYSYVPDKAPVRSKMLYASTRATLLKNLGDTRIATAIFATSRADLTHSAYLSHLSHLSIDAPLTARESEMAELKAAERAEQIAGTDVSDGGRAGQPAWSGTVGLSWSGEAKALLKEFAKSRGEGDIVRLEVDTKKEEVVASNPQPTMLELPLETPSYSFLRHARGVVFIYSCPPSSPIKSRLLYSSSVGGVMQNAKALGVEVSKKIETSEPGEVTGDFVDAEFGPGSGTATPTDSAPMPASEEKKFAKPSRPGRRR